MTADGERLTRLYTEMDLVAAEALRHGLWRGLTPAELAAAVSVLVYEARRDPAAPPKTARWSRAHRDRGDAAAGATTCPPSSGTTGSRRSGIPTPGSPGRPTAGPVATGSRRCCTRASSAAGDFVRWCKQLIDLLGQVATASDDDELSAAARTAIGALRRGVVAAE